MQSDNGFSIEVTYPGDKVDLQDYCYTNSKIKKTWKLKDELQLYISNKLKEGIKFPVLTSEAVIMNQKIRLSGQSGLFQFDPFLFLVKFKLCNQINDFNEYCLKRNNKIRFKYFKIQGDDLSKNKEQITYKTQISVVLQQVGQKLGIKPQILQKYKTKFQFEHFKVVSDLKMFDEQNFYKIFSLIPRIFLKEVYQFSMIDCYREGFHESKKLKMLKDQKGKLQCIKLSNGHKLLRYFIYKKSKQELNDIPYLNRSAIKKARQIIQAEISMNKQIWDRVDEFLIQFGLPHNKNYEYSRGAIFNGPPGTGKTVLTELLISLCGFFQISKGISAADLMKSLVGQAGRYIQNLFQRADVCPWLATFISIDQIESAFPRRDNEESKNKGEVISKFLSMIEGNKNVPNLFILSATNHIDKIDDAVLRRLGDRNDLARLNSGQRKQIFMKHFQKQQFSKYEPFMQKILECTMNFTGAAMVKLLSQLQNKLLSKYYFDEKSNKNITNQQVMSLIHKIAKEYKIFFGSGTFPELAEQNIKLRRYLNRKFLEKIDCSLMFIGLDRSNLFNVNLFYFNKKIINKVQQKLIVAKELEMISFNTYEDAYKINNQSLLTFFKKEFQVCFHSKNIITCHNIEEANQKFSIAESINQQPVILLMMDQAPILYKKGPKQIIEGLQCYRKDKNNVYFFYICQFAEVSCYVGHEEHYSKYSGRVMVEINESPQIVYEIEKLFPYQSPYYIQHYLPADTRPVSTDLNDVIIKFFNKKKLSNIFIIDNSFLESKGAFTNQKECQIIKGVFQEAKQQRSVAVIIDFDSLLINTTKKSMNKDEQQQFDVDNKNLYKALINRCKDFACISENTQRWIVLIALDNKLIKKIRNDIAWPQMPQQIKERSLMEELNRKRTCYRCGQQYTQKQNQEQKKCAQHPGLMINTGSKKMSELSLESAIVQNQRQEYIQQNQAPQTQRYQTQTNKMPLYIYSCCFANVKEVDNFCAKMNLFRHIEQKDFQSERDDLHKFRNSKIGKWYDNLKTIK